MRVKTAIKSVAIVLVVAMALAATSGCKTLGGGSGSCGGCKCQSSSCDK